MKKPIKSIFVFFTLSVFFILAAATAKVKWQKVRASQGITVFKKKVPDSNHLIFKGKGVVRKEMVYVLSVLADVVNTPKWIETLKTMIELEAVSETEKILYNEIETPWPLTNRDVIVRAKFYYDKKNQWIHIQTKSIKSHPKAPKDTGHVRIPYIKSQWSLKAINKGKATWVEFKVQADPGGIIPTWAANMAAKNIPFKSIRNLRRRVAQGKFNYEIIEIFKKYDAAYDSVN